MLISLTALFHLYFDDTVIDFMVEMTNLYAQRDKSKHDFLTSPVECGRSLLCYYYLDTMCFPGENSTGKTAQTYVVKLCLVLCLEIDLSR